MAVRQGTSLDKDFDHPRQTLKSTYKMCLEAEKYVLDELKADLTEAQESELWKKLKNIRILGHLLAHGPSDASKNHIVKTILTDCIGVDGDSLGPSLEVGTTTVSVNKLAHKGQYFDTYLLHPFNRAGYRTPQPSHHPSRRSFEVPKEQIKELLLQNPANHQQAKELALLRDGHMDMISGRMDRNYHLEIYFPKHGANFPGGVAGTECAHIFPQSINRDTKGNPNKCDAAATFWTIMEMFGYPDIRKELEAKGINSLTNVLTLGLEAHDMFDTFGLWFEATDTLHSYLIRLAPGHGDPTIIGLQTDDLTVTFRSHGDTDAPINNILPNPTYLRIHAAVSEVAHMSGAAGYYNLARRDMDEGGGNSFAEALAVRLEGIGGVYSVPFSPVVDPV